MQINIFRNGLLNFKYIGLLLILIFACTCSFSAAASAKTYRFDLKDLLLKGKNPRLYLFYNSSDTKILLDHEQPMKNQGMNAGWGSQLDPKRCSVLLMDRPRFLIDCHAFRKDYQFRRVFCRRVLRVQTIQSFTILNGSLIDANAWITENRNCKKLLKFIQRRGIKLN